MTGVHKVLNQLKSYKQPILPLVILKKYKNRWDLGPKNSGDIDNFKHYTKLASKAQLITGAPYEFNF